MTIDFGALIQKIFDFMDRLWLTWLVAGKALANTKHDIIGISVGRSKDYILFIHTGGKIELSE